MLSPINFSNKTPAEIEADLIGGYEALANRTLAPADPIRIFLQSLSSYLIQQTALIDFTGSQNLLSYAGGDYLDAIGELFGVIRSPAIKAKTTVIFTLSDIRESDTLIPKDTRLTADNIIFFRLTNDLIIPKGQLTIEGIAEADTPGSIANGFNIGSINTIVDPIPFVDTVSNLEVSGGGVDIESDDNLRLRIKGAPARFSVAGSIGAYNYFTRSYSQDIEDVSVFSPTPGIVNIFPLFKGGRIPTDAEIEEIKSVLSADEIRPLTDKVEVLAPDLIYYDIDLTYYVRPTLNLSALKINIENAVNDFIIWQKSKIGRDINPSELIARLIQAGAKRAEIRAPLFIDLNNFQVACESDINIIYGGAEDD